MKNRDTKIYKTKCKMLPNDSRSELVKMAWRIYHREEAKTRRTPYIKTRKKSYFKGRKIFLSLYFPHLKQKSAQDQARRLRLFEASLELIKNTPYEPIIRSDMENNREVMRFFGETKDGVEFCV